MNYGLTKENHISIKNYASKRRGRSRHTDIRLANLSIKLSKLSPKQRNKLIKLQKQGMNYSRIQEILGTSIHLTTL